MCNTQKVTFEEASVFTDSETIFDKTQLLNFCCALQQAVLTHETLLLLPKSFLVALNTSHPTFQTLQAKGNYRACSFSGGGSKTWLISGILIPVALAVAFVLTPSLWRRGSFWKRNPWLLPLQCMCALHFMADSCVYLPEGFLCLSEFTLAPACQTRTGENECPTEAALKHSQELLAQLPPFSGRVTLLLFFLPFACLFNLQCSRVSPVGSAPVTHSGSWLDNVRRWLPVFLTHILTSLLAFLGIISKINYL